MIVRYVDYGKAYQKIKPEIDATLQKCLAEGNLIMRQDMEDFEANLAKYIGVKYAVAVNSGTDALYIAMKAAGIGKGDKVITVSHTFLATIETIVRCGAKPLLVDIDDTYEMDMRGVEDLIAFHNGKVRAIVPVHLSGDMVDMDWVKVLADKYNLIVIEDAAQAIGATWGDTKAGAFGLAGCFSFYPAKILGCYGDGGAITTNDKRVYEYAKKSRNHWNIKQTGLYTKDITPPELEWWGNSRMDNIQAAALNVKLKYLDDNLARRQAIAERYTDALKDIVITPTMREGRVFQDYVIRAERRNELHQFLKEKDIETLGADQIPNHLYRGLNLDMWKLPKTEKYISEFLRLPCNYEIEDEQVEYVIEQVKNFYVGK